ncbi:hypothetical protein [Amycolatopsis sp. FDAARGOS 1241]|uniref:hypothetical protein n=1 Tax=Amycolatopsis sp. FDAARGOS 1241 TaxID=2778070 RepID=UPI001950926B|nr:hypothetical protein [Amycolatopsis sp. FDAARGOS 1241]QRP45845.1 hypothetical protein I6J71_43355 [Amycolatopsis sp. FDAARGOS 1241]
MRAHELKQAGEVDEIIERDYAEAWLRRGEKLLLGCPPAHGHVVAWVGGELRLPYQPAREPVKVTTAPGRWPAPAGLPDEDWTDDPTLAYRVTAASPADVAARIADHLAFSAGAARLTWTNKRLALVYPTRFVVDAATKDFFVTDEQFPPDVVARLDAVTPGRSFPPEPALHFTFTDGSTLAQRDLLAPMKVRRALSRR